MGWVFFGPDFSHETWRLLSELPEFAWIYHDQTSRPSSFQNGNQSAPSFVPNIAPDNRSFMTLLIPNTFNLTTLIAMSQRDVTPPVVHSVASRILNTKNAEIASSGIFYWPEQSPLAVYRGSLNENVDASLGIVAETQSVIIDVGTSIEIQVTVSFGNNGGGKKTQKRSPGYKPTRKSKDDILTYLRDVAGVEATRDFSIENEDGVQISAGPIDRHGQKRSCDLFATDVKRIEGIVKLVDPTKFTKVLMTGIGGRKNYGFGMIFIIEGSENDE